MNTIKYILLSFLFIGFIGCEPYEEDKITLGPPPNPSFEIIPGDTPNTFTLKNTTNGAFLTSWDLGAYGIQSGDEYDAYIPFKGDYEITMTTFNEGGSASTTQTFTVTEDDPNACFGNFEILTGCSERTWKLANEPDALIVGPALDGYWWGNSEDDLIERSCHFDDLYIFRSSGEFEYKNNGDFWVDSDSDGNAFPAELGLSVGCHDSSELPEAFQSWGSGVHAFTTSEATSDADGTLTVSGEGAWIGIYKIGTAGEVGTPQSSVTLNIAEITANYIILYADYGGTVWRVKLTPE